MKSFRFSRSERLKSRKAIGRLFSEGKSFHRYPVRVLYQWLQNSDHRMVKCAFVVPQRTFRKAVSRNRIKRQMREAYRLNKYLLLDQLEGQALHLMFVYSAKEPLPYHKIEASICRILHKLSREINTPDED